MTPFSFVLERLDGLLDRSEKVYRTDTSYIPFRSSVDYWRRETKDGKKMLLEQEACCGIRWQHGPVWFDSFLTDEEPRMDPGPTRFVMWQPLTPHPSARGWHRSWIQMNPRATGYAPIGSRETYWHSWTGHAQRHRSKWLKEERFSLEEISHEEFCRAYRLSDRLGGWLKGWFIEHLKMREACHGSRLHLFGARERKSGEVLAGLAVLDIPEIRSSLHVISFLDAKALDSSVGTGLIDHWFRHGIERGWSYLDFDLFWAPGDPRAWQGFSRFKSQFGTRIIHYPMPFVRCVRARR